MPDENKKGKRNLGVIAQYPFFAPDAEYLKKAPKMTKADELYLKRFVQAVDAQTDAKVHETVLGGEDKGDELEEVEINPRLHVERSKISITEQIYANKIRDDDTSHEPAKNEKVKNDWSSTASIPKHILDKAKKQQPKGGDYPEIAGNVVPFFPSEWNKANIMYENMLDIGGPKIQASNEEFPNLYKNYGLLDNTKPDIQISGERPSSGKHFARIGPGKLHEKQYIADDPLKSNVADKFDKTKQVEKLLNKLAGYMAGEIPSYEDDTKDDQKPEVEVDDEQSPKRNFGFLKNFEPVRYTLLEHPKEDPTPMDIDNSDYEVDDGKPKIQLVEHGLDGQETFFPKIDNKISTQKKPKPKNGTRFIDIDIHTYKEMEFNLTAVKGN